MEFKINSPIIASKKMAENFALSIVGASAILFVILFIVAVFALCMFFVKPAHALLPGLKYEPVGIVKITNFHAVTPECDSTPDIGAGGRVAINGVPTGPWFASWRFPFGTKIIIPSISGDKVWICRDRTAKYVWRKSRKYFIGDRIDLLYPIGQNIKGGLIRAEVYGFMK